MGWGVFQMQWDDDSVRYSRDFSKHICTTFQSGCQGTFFPCPGNSNYDASLALSLRLWLLHRHLTCDLCCFVRKDSGGYNRDYEEAFITRNPTLPPDFLGYS